MITRRSFLLKLEKEQIGYLPEISCPKCGAPLIAKDGQIYRPFQAVFGRAEEYDPYLGYLSFNCACHLNMSNEEDPALGGTLRVVRVGDAVLPLDLVTHLDKICPQEGITAGEINSVRLHQAVQFLASHADPVKLTGGDALKMILYEVASGRSPEAAYQAIKLILAGNLPDGNPACNQAGSSYRTITK